MKTSLNSTWLAIVLLASGCALPGQGSKSSDLSLGAPEEFSDRLPSFQFDKADPEAKTVGSLVFQVQRTGSISTEFDPGFLIVLANSVVIYSDCEGLRKGDVFVAEFPQMAAMLDQSILYPNQIEAGDLITIAVTKIGAKRICGFWMQRKRGQQASRSNLGDAPRQPGAVTAISRSPRSV